MIEVGRDKFPASLSSEKNDARRIDALATESFRLEAEARRLELEAGDTISIVQASAVKKKRELAQSIYSEMIALQTKHHNGLSTMQKAKPHIINAIIAIVVAAEIISIPILLANIYMMCKKHHHPINA